MSNLNPKTTSEAVARPNGETTESMFGNAEVLLEWRAIEKNKVYNLTKSAKEFRFVYFLFSYDSTGSLTNSSLVPTQAIRSDTGTSLNAIMLNNIVTTTIFANAQVGFPSPSTFTMNYIESKNPDGNSEILYLRIYGIK